jgi:hypothetical protein
MQPHKKYIKIIYKDKFKTKQMLKNKNKKQKINKKKNSTHSLFI